jgi:nucleoid-associated protein EbfC
MIKNPLEVKMSKGKAGRQPMPMPRMNPANAQNAIQKLQQQMLETQELLATETVEVSAGGGAVKIVVTGQQKIQSIEISPEVLGSGDREMVQDLLVAAMNQAIEKSQELASTRLGALTGGLKIPGLM